MKVMNIQGMELKDCKISIETDSDKAMKSYRVKFSCGLLVTNTWFYRQSYKGKTLAIAKHSEHHRDKHVCNTTWGLYILRKPRLTSECNINCLMGNRPQDVDRVILKEPEATFSDMLQIGPTLYSMSSNLIVCSTCNLSFACPHVKKYENEFKKKARVILW